MARDYKGLGNQQATAVLVYGNKRLNETLEKYDNIEDKPYIDAYNKTIKQHIAGTILEGVDYRNHTYIAIKEATKKGYSLAEKGDGIYLDRPEQKRGVVQKKKIPTLKCTGNDIGVVVGEY